MTEVVAAHAHTPHLTLDGGDLDCGGGLLVLIRKHMDRLAPGQLLEILSTEISVDEDLPAWCRMTGNTLVSLTRKDKQRSFLVSRGTFDPASTTGTPSTARPVALALQAVPITIPATLPTPAPAPPLPPLAVTGIGSWPRPRWMREAIHAHQRGQLTEADLHATADDAVRLVVAAQQRAGVDVFTDGEQRRDSYASFVGGRLDNAMLVTLADVAAMVDHPDDFEAELRALDVPSHEVRHPVVFGPLGRSRPLAAHELAFVRTLTDGPVKVALPGPYLLTRTMWLECLRDGHYRERDTLARDIARVLREEIYALLAAGASLVQLDEPVLTEVVLTGPKPTRSFMCGALSEKGDAAEELDFALRLLTETVMGLPRERLAMHVCRGNWTRDESVLLRGDYRPLLPLLQAVPVGTLFLEYATERAGALDLLAEIPADKRVGVGLVNPRIDAIESTDDIETRARRALEILGPSRTLLNPDCGFATFADNPVASTEIAERKLAALVETARRLRSSM